MHDLRQVFEHAAVDRLVGPSEVVAGSHGRILGIVLQQLRLHIIDDPRAEEDAHRALATRQQVQLLLLRHSGTPFATREDDGLRLLGDGELRAELRRCCLEGGDPWRDVVAHPVLVEEGHLLLDRPVDTRVTRMQTRDQKPLVVELLHQGELLLKVHIRRAAHDGTRLSAERQRLRHEAPRVKDEVGMLQPLTSADGDEVGVARPCTDDLDVATTLGSTVER